MASEVQGRLYASTFSGNTPTLLNNASSSITAAYNQAMAEKYTTTQAAAVVFDGMTFTPGVVRIFLSYPS